MIDVTKFKIADANRHEADYIAELITFEDKRLEKHLKLIQKQIEIAFKKGMYEALDLLQIYENQIIEARVLKLENTNKNKKK